MYIMTDKNIYKIIPDVIHSDNLARIKRSNFIEYHKTDKTVVNETQINTSVISAHNILEIYDINTLDELDKYIYETINNNIIYYYDNITNKNYRHNFGEINVSSDINSIYNITFFNDKILHFNTLNRVFTAMIIDKYHILKTHHKGLIDIVLLIVPLMFEPLIKTIPFVDIVPDYLDYWFEKNDITNFNLNLLNDLKIYISKKYKN